MPIDDVQDLAPRVHYVAAAAQTAFPYPFPIFQAADLAVIVDGVLKVLTTHYAVSGAGADLGGNVTFVTPMIGGEIVTIYRDTTIERLSDQQQNGPIASSVFNDEFDKAYTIMQELDEKFDRAPLAAVTDDVDMSLGEVDDRAGLIFAFDEQGEPAFLTPAEVATTAAFINMRAETFEGDGAEDTFALADSPGVVANTYVYIDGIRMVPIIDYTLSGTDVEFTDPPYDGAEILISYGVAFPVGTIEYEQTPAEAAVGVNPSDLRIPSHDSAGVIRPQRYGFSESASAAVNTAAIHAAQDVAAELGSSGGIECHLGPGTFSIQEITISINNFLIVGAGRTATRLSCDAVATNGIAVLFYDGDEGTSSILSSGITKVGFIKSDSNTKTAVKFIDGRQCEFTYIGISTGTWAGNGAIGLHTQGRDFLNIRYCDIECGRPWLLDNNPSGDALISTLNADMFRVFRTQFYTQVSTGICVEISSGAELTNLMFDNCNFAGGRYGVYQVDTAATIAQYNLHFLNCRFEQAADATGYDVYLTTTQTHQSVLFANCGFSVGRRALYLRNAQRITLTNCQSASVETAVLDITFLNTTELILQNAFFQTGATHTLTSAILTRADPYPSSLYSLPLTAAYRYDEANVLSQRPALGYNSMRKWSYQGTLADAATLNTPVTRALYACAIIKVSAYSATGPIHCGGAAVWTRDGTMTKIGGSANFVVAAVGVELRCLDGGSGLVIVNVLGQSITIVIDIEFV